VCSTNSKPTVAIIKRVYNGRMRKLYVHQTRIGPFYIVVADNGKYSPQYDGEPLGEYSSPEQAVDDLAGGHTFPNSGGVDTATLGIPDELGEW
jgi:hypothetical protein